MEKLSNILHRPLKDRIVKWLDFGINGIATVLIFLEVAIRK